MPEPAFMVEGHMEQIAIQKICPGKKVSLLGTGGRSVTMKRLADVIETKYRILNNRNFPIVVMFDRENRPETCFVLRNQLESELTSRALDVDQFIICILDRDIETWLLGHVDQAGEFQETGSDLSLLDGASGQTELKKRLLKKGVVYHKTTIGATLLSKVVPDVLEPRSVCFALFRRSLVSFCSWAIQ